MQISTNNWRITSNQKPPKVIITYSSGHLAKFLQRVQVGNQVQHESSKVQVRYTAVSLHSYDQWQCSTVSNLIYFFLLNKLVRISFQSSSYITQRNQDSDNFQFSGSSGRKTAKWNFFFSPIPLKLVTAWWIKSQNWEVRSNKFGPN